MVHDRTEGPRIGPVGYVGGAMRHGGVFVILAGMLLSGGPMAAGADRLLDRLRINHAAMVSSERDFHEQQRRGRLSSVETADYAAYVARLHRLVAEDCAELLIAGVDLPPELGCPVLSQPIPAPAAIDQTAEATPAEQIAALDAELLGGLGDFDEMLLREQERIRAAAPRDDATDVGEGAGAGAEGDGGEGGGGEADASGAGEGESTPGGTGDAVAGMGGRAQGDRSRRPGGRAGVPPDIPDGDGDDVVARQLREAAEKETSPELKAKLWEEYRRYKTAKR